MIKKIILDDKEDVRDIVLKNHIKVFELLYGYDGNIFSNLKKSWSYKTIYHLNNVSETLENMIRPEGIEIYYPEIKFGLKERVLTKIK